MSNVLSDEKKQQVIALRRVGWSLGRIELATGVRRETASVYRKAAGVVACLPGWVRRCPAKPAMEVTPDRSKPALQETTDPGGGEAEGPRGSSTSLGEISVGNFGEFHPGRESNCETMPRVDRAGAGLWPECSTTSGWSALWSMIWDTSIGRLGCLNRSKIRSAQKCYPCLRYIV